MGQRETGQRGGGSALSQPVALTKGQVRYRQRRAREQTARADADARAVARDARGQDARGRSPEEQRAALVDSLSQAVEQVRLGVPFRDAWREAAVTNGNYDAVSRAVRKALGAREVREDSRHAESILAWAIREAGGARRRRGGPAVSSGTSPAEVERIRRLLASRKGGGHV